MHGRRLNPPLWLLASFAYLAFYTWALLWIIFWPLIFLYGLALRALAWKSLRRRGKCALAVHDETKYSEAWMSRIEAVIQGRALYLNYDQHKNWRPCSLAVQLFQHFGPHPIPRSFMRHSLPAVIVFEKYGRPKLFKFGSLGVQKGQDPEKLREETLERLRSTVLLSP